MKKLLRISLIPLCIIIVVILYIFFVLNNNQKYLDNLTKNIKDNYKLDGNITYSNKYGNYYIFTTESKVFVLNNQFEEILIENISKIKTKEDMELIYKTNKLMYEEKEVNDNLLVYKYYDAKTGEFIKETKMELK